MPDRIQRTRAKGDRLPPGTLCVTRPGRMGNPFEVGYCLPHGWEVLCPGGLAGDICDKLVKEATGNPFATEVTTTQLAVDCYAVWAPQQPWFAEALEKAREALHIACWCPVGSPCHGDLWVAWANEEKRP